MIQFNVAPKSEDLRPDIDPPAQPARVFDVRSQTAVVESRVELNHHFGFALFALDLPEQFVLRPKSSLFFFLQGNRHKIGQHNSCRIGRERCLEHVCIFDVTPARLRVALGTNAPAAANSWIKNRTEDRRAIESWPAKPIERATV